MENPKLRGYHRYRRFANAILLAAVTVLAFILVLEAADYRHPLLPLVSYLAEAVLVASVADFIAILALTRPIPGLKFTGLIQKKRKELIDGFVNACETRILPKQTILQMVKGLDIVKLLKQNLNDATVNEEAPALGKAIAGFLRHESTGLTEAVARRVIAQVGTIDTGLALIKLEELAVRKGWISVIVRRLFDSIAAEADKDDFVDELEMRIRRAVARNRLTGGVLKRFWSTVKTWAGEKSDTINYRELSEKLAATLKDILANIQSGGRDDERWLEMERFVGELLKNLAQNRVFVRDLKEWQAEVLTEERLSTQIEKLLHVLADWLEDGRLTSREINATLQFQLMNEAAHDIDITQWLADLVLKGLEALEKNDAVVRAEFGKLADAFVEKEYVAVLEIIRDVLSRLSDRGLVEKVHEVAGSNLQWLRISGGYIGLVAGLLLFLISTWPIYGLPFLIILTGTIMFVKPVRRRLVILSR